MGPECIVFLRFHVLLIILYALIITTYGSLIFRGFIFFTFNDQSTGLRNLTDVEGQCSGMDVTDGVT